MPAGSRDGFRMNLKQVWMSDGVVIGGKGIKYDERTHSTLMRSQTNAHTYIFTHTYIYIYILAVVPVLRTVEPL